MQSLIKVAVALLLCTSVVGNNYTMDLQTYLKSLWDTHKNNFMGNVLPNFYPKLDLKQLVQLTRGQMSKPFPALGLPALDPLKLDFMPFQVDHEIGRYEGHAENVTVLHLAQFEVERLVLNMADLKANFNFSFNELQMSGLHEVEGAFAQIVPTWGRGDFGLSAHDVKLFGSLEVGTDREFLYMRTFDMDFTLRQVTGAVHGLHGGGPLGEVLSAVLLELAPTLLDMVRPELGPWLSRQVLEQSNRRLTDLAIKKNDVMEWVKKVATNKIFSLARTT